MSSKDQKSAASRRDEARAQVAALREAQLKKEKRTRNITFGALGVVVIALIAVFVVVFTQQQDNNKVVAGDEVPKAASVNDGYPVGADGKAGTENGADAVQVTTFLDYMCPGCAQFEGSANDVLNELRESGDITMILHPLSILDRLSQGTQFSTRAASAAAMVAEEAPDKLLDFNTKMFENQPEENSTGLTDEKIGEIAKEAGVPDDVATKISNGDAMKAYGGWVGTQTEKVTSNKAYWHPGNDYFSTPTILIDGKVYEGEWDSASIKKAVEDAKNS